MKNQHNKTFISFTGTSSLDEMNLIIEACQALVLPENVQLNMGMLVSDDIVNGIDIPNPRFPEMDDMMKLLEACIHSPFTPVIHYCSKSVSPSKALCKSLLTMTISLTISPGSIKSTEGVDPVHAARTRTSSPIKTGQAIFFMINLLTWTSQN